MQLIGSSERADMLLSKCTGVGFEPEVQTTTLSLHVHVATSIVQVTNSNWTRVTIISKKASFKMIAPKKIIR